MIYRPEIDGLRALAVIPVIFFHAGINSFSGGFVGVDVFFVISGYLISSLIHNELIKNDFSLVTFYERRARRLLPALFAVIFVSILISLLILPPVYLKDFGQSVMAVSIFSSNILFWLESGYFDTASELKPLLHTWSLAIEEQFYLIFPLLAIFLYKPKLQRFYILVVLLIFILSFWTSNYLVNIDSGANFFLLPSRIWELLLGVLAGEMIRHKYVPSNKILNELLSLLGVILIIYSIVFFDESTPFPSYYALVPTVGTAFIIISANKDILINKIFSNKFLVGIGLISYSAYLIHQPIFSFYRHSALTEPSLFLKLFLSSLSLLLAFLSYKFIEQPFRRKGKFTTKKVFTLSFIFSFSFILAGFYFHTQNGLPQRANFEETLTKSFERPDRHGCYDQNGSHYLEDWGCEIGSQKEQVSFILFGDSHSLSFKDTFNEIALSNERKGFYVGASGCLPFLGLYMNRNDQNIIDCNKLNRRVLEYAKEKNIKKIFLSSRWSLYTFGDYRQKGMQLIRQSENEEYSKENNELVFKNGLMNTIEAYSNNGIEIIIISQPPMLQHSPESIYFIKNKRKKPLSDFATNRSEFNLLEASYKSKFLKQGKKITYIDLAELLCSNEICPVGEDNISYYYDDDHLSSYGAQLAEEILINLIK